MNVNLKSLVGRLNDVARGALEGAAGLCLSRTNYDVEVEHILAKILEQDDTDLHKIASHYEINIDRLNKDVQNSLDRLISDARQARNSTEGRRYAERLRESNLVNQIAAGEGVERGEIAEIPGDEKAHGEAPGAPSPAPAGGGPARPIPAAPRA